MSDPSVPNSSNETNYNDSIDALIDGIHDLNLQDPSHPAQTLGSSPLATMATRVYDGWTEWDGQPSTFRTWHVGLTTIALDPAMTNRLGGNRHFVSATYNKVHASRRDEVTPYLSERLADASIGYSIQGWLDHLKDQFEPKDLEEKAQEKIYAIRQGPAQTYASFQADFDSLCAQAGQLAPTSAAKCVTHRRALNADLQSALSYRSDVPTVVYKDLVSLLRPLGITREAVSEFATRKGSAVSQYVDAKGTLIVPPGQGQTNHTNQQPKIAVDREGDTHMGGVNTVSSLTQLVSSLSTMVNALVTNNSPMPAINNV